MSVVKLPMIRAQACSKILDLAIFSSQEALSLHFAWANFFWLNIPFGKGNDTGWCGSPGRSGSLAILYVSLMRVYLCMYPAGFYYSMQFSLGTSPHKVKRIIFSSLAENGPAMHGRTSRSGSGAYVNYKVQVY